MDHSGSSAARLPRVGTGRLPGEGDGPRDRMVRSAAALIARDGLRATGMREVADHAQAPRGSMRHYFPGGKHQLVKEAMTWMGAVVRDELQRAAGDPAASSSASRSPATSTPGRALAVLKTFVRMWRQTLTDTDIAAGCSIAAVVHDSDDPELLAPARDVFTSWREPFHQALLADGASAQTAESLATVALAALEGAVILCRAQRDLTPLEQTGAVLRDLLQPPRQGTSR
jgi:AcrR family transcriptional regulator